MTAPRSSCDDAACRKRERARHMESLGALAGGMVHDFNNVLSGIVGNANLAQLDVDPSSEAASALEDLRLATERASDLTQQLLAVSGRCIAAAQPVDLAAMLVEVYAALVPALPPRTRLTRDVAPGLPLVLGEPARLRHVVRELVLNATESIGDAEGTIAIRAGTTDVTDARCDALTIDGGLPAGTHVFVEVQDSGAGMSPETLERAFDPFFSTKPRRRGFGLASAMGMVRAQKAAMEVSSAPGAGATFRLLMPIDPSQVAPRAVAPAARAAVPAGGTILIVDDETAVRNVTRRLLARQGYEVVEASNGPDGIAILEQAPARITCVLLDLSMPGMDGRETFQRMRAVVPELRVVFVSGHGESDFDTELDDRGLAGFLHKPFDLATLLRTTRAAMERKAS